MNLSRTFKLLKPESSKPKFGTSRIYSIGWGIFLAITVGLALGARAVVVQNQKAIQANIQAHLELILQGTAAVLDAQLLGTAAHMEDSIRLIESQLIASPKVDDQDYFLKLLMRDLRPVPALAVGFTDSSGKTFLSTPHLLDNMNEIRFEGMPFKTDSQMMVEFSLPFRSRLENNDSSAENILVLWRAGSEELRKNGIENIYAFTDGRKQMEQALQPGRSGTTGELYAFDRNGLMISDSRFNEHLYSIGFIKSGQQAALRVKVVDPGNDLVHLAKNALSLKQDSTAPLTLMAQSATQGNSSSNLEGYADYRGVAVVGSWIWLKQLGFGIAHEVDYAEAYENIGILNWTFLTLLCLLFAATVAMGILAWRASANEDQSHRTREKLEALQRDIHHYNRINTLGQLATGMAHELNQPLTTIVNFARALLMRIRNNQLDDRAEFEKQLIQIEKNASLSGDIIRRMRGFLRSDQRSMKRLSLRDLVRESQQLLEHEMSKIKLRFEIEPMSDPGWINGDEVQLQQVLLNLMKNSIEALKTNGSLDNMIKVKIITDTKNETVSFELKDNGPGISPEIRSRVFDQFVTTKTGGMGLGLAICESIVESHDGSIQLMESEHGAHFRLRFPMSQEIASAASQRPQLVHS
jgi:signal transduction histidine kinase